MMKICKHCGEAKEDIEFHRNGKWIKNTCKKCSNSRHSAWAKQNREHINEKHREWVDKNRVLLNEYMKEYMKEYRKTEKHKQKQKKYREKYPEKIKAVYKLNNKIVSGKIKRGNCVICGEPNTQAHHPNYSKPLDVIWLCVKHHVEHHHSLLQ